MRRSPEQQPPHAPRPLETREPADVESEAGRPPVAATPPSQLTAPAAAQPATTPPLNRSAVDAAVAAGGDAALQLPNHRPRRDAPAPAPVPAPAPSSATPQPGSQPGQPGAPQHLAHLRHAYADEEPGPEIAEISNEISSSLPSPPAAEARAGAPPMAVAMPGGAKPLPASHGAPAQAVAPVAYAVGFGDPARGGTRGESSTSMASDLPLPEATIF